MNFKILKTIITLGIMMLSSIAVGQEKYTYREPLSGVDSSPFFALSKTERQALCLNEKINLVDDIKYETELIEELMPTGEVLTPEYWHPTVFDGAFARIYYDIHSSKTDTWVLYYNIVYTQTKDGATTEQYKNDYYVFLNRSEYPSASDIYQFAETYKSREQGQYEQSLGAYQKDDMWGKTYSLILEPLELQEVEKEVEISYQREVPTENYDWCVFNGYQTG